MQLLFDEIGVALDEDQYRDVISLVDMYHVFLRKRQVIYKPIYLKCRVVVTINSTEGFAALKMNTPRIQLRKDGDLRLPRFRQKSRRNGENGAGLTLLNVAMIGTATFLYFSGSLLVRFQKTCA